MATKRQEHNANVLENEMKRLTWVYHNGGQVSWNIMDTCYKDRYRCLVCMKHKYNLDFFHAVFAWNRICTGKETVFCKTKEGKICSPECCNEAKVREQLSSRLDDIATWNKPIVPNEIKVSFIPSNKKNYICKGCRRRKKFSEPFMTLGYRHIEVNEDPETKSYSYFFGRVCSDECYNLMVFKMQR
jgi:hypothetical protein